MPNLFILDSDPVFQAVTELMNDTYKLGFTVCCYNEISSLVEFLENHSVKSDQLPDVIFVEICSFAFNGWDAMEELASFYRTSQKAAAIYVVTTSIIPADRVKALEFEIVKDYILKPLTKEKMIAIREAVLRY